MCAASRRSVRAANSVASCVRTNRIAAVKHLVLDPFNQRALVSRDRFAAGVGGAVAAAVGGAVAAGVGGAVAAGVGVGWRRSGLFGAALPAVSGSAHDHEHDSGANDYERDLSQRRRRSFAPARTLEQE